METEFKWPRLIGSLVFNLLTVVFVFAPKAYAMTCADVFSDNLALIRLSSYDNSDQISQIASGLTVEFSGGERFKIDRVISTSGTDGIFEVQNNQILRISKSGGITIDQYIDGAPALTNAGIPIPKIIEFKRGERILVEKIEVQFHLEDLFLRGDKFSPQMIDTLKIQFMNFVAKFRGFNQVSDIHANQIVYAKDRGWMLLDWRDFHRFGTSINPFTPVWRSVEVIAQKRNLSFDKEMVREWQLDSDRAIANARGQDPENYYNMTHERLIELLYND